MKANAKPKPTDEDFAMALVDLSQLRFFPTDPLAPEGILRLLRQLVGTRDQLAWLIGALVNRVGEWPGPAQVRGLFCTRFRPADGIEADCSLPGYTADDCEAQSVAAGPEKQLPPAGQKLLAAMTREYELVKEIEFQQGNLVLFAKYPKLLEEARRKIAELEQELASLRMAA